MTPNRESPPKEAKQITEYSKIDALSIWTIHFLPIATTSVLLCLNFRNLFFESVGASNQNFRFNSMQFAAKLHEVSINFSLSTIVLNFIQYELIHGKGVPFGSLFAPFQVNSLSSLWSPGLWATSGADGSKLRRFLLITIIIISVILASIVGPASAILMMPSLGYWNEQILPEYNIQAGDGRKKPLRYFIGAPFSSLWPTSISNTTFYPGDCNSTASLMPPWCPLGGFSTLLQLASSSWYSDENSQWNITMQSPTNSTTEYNRYIAGMMRPTSVSSYITTTTSLFAGNFLASAVEAFVEALDMSSVDKRLILTLSNGSQSLAPVVASLCWNLDYQWMNDIIWEGMSDSDMGGPSVQSNLSEIRFPLTEDGSQNWSYDASRLLHLWNNSTRTATLFVDPPNLGEMTPSTGVIFPIFRNSSHSHATIISCSVYATWQPTDMYTNTLGDNFIHSASLNDMLITFSTTDMDQDLFNSKRQISIDGSWANSELSPNNTLGELTRKSFPTDDGTYGDLDWTYNNAFGVSTSIFLADVISRVGSQNSLLVGQNVSNQSGVFMIYEPSQSFSWGAMARR